MAMLAPEFPPDRGGMQRFAFESAAAVSRAGVSITIFTHPHDAGRSGPPGCEVRPELTNSFRDNRELLRRVGECFDLWHIMNAAWSWAACVVPAAVLTVYGNDLISPNRVAGFELKDRLRLPKGDRFENWANLKRTQYLMRRCIPEVRHVLPISRFTGDLFRRRYPGYHGRMSVSHPGVGDEFFPPPLTPEANPKWGNGMWVNVPRLLTVCRLSERRKNVNLVIEALAELRQEFAYEYHVVGDGNLLPKLRRLADRSGVGDRIHFRGEMDDGELRTLYTESDLFILTPSADQHTVEGFGMVYLEANAAGVPVLAARTGGVPDAVEQSVSGLLVEEPTVPAVREQLRVFLSGETQFDRTACREHAEQFRWHRTIGPTLDAYHEVIRSNATWSCR